MPERLCVPVCRVAAEIVTADGGRHALVLFHAPSQTFEEFVESNEPFLPADAAGKISLVARCAIACFAVAPQVTRDAAELDGLPLKRQRVQVRLSGGTVLDGEIRFVVEDGRGRTVDFLNRSTRTFALFGDTSVFHVSKAHIERVEEGE